jgi:hypothetical protein
VARANVTRNHLRRLTNPFVLEVVSDSPNAAGHFAAF